MLDTKNLAIVPDDDGISVGDYIYFYITTYKSASLKQSSLTRDYGILNNQIKPSIGEIKLSKLTSMDIQSQLINKLKDKNYSLSTIHKAYTLLNEAMKQAIQDSKIIINPCTGIKLPSKNVIIPKKIEVLDDDEISLFIKAAMLQTTKNSLAILIVLYTGLRVGELCALRWEDLDYVNKK